MPSHPPPDTSRVWPSAISRQPVPRTTWLGLAALALICACGGRQRAPAETPPAGPAAPRVLPLGSVFQVETGGPPPPDTSVSFTTGTARMIVVHHGGEGIAFARLSFAAAAFGDSGRPVSVEVRPSPGLYGLDFSTSLPFRGGQAELTFVYGRYFLAPARARQVYGSDAAFERALAVGRVLPDGQIELLPSTRPGADNLRAVLPSTGRYLMAAPQ